MRRIKKLKTLVYALMGTTLISACSSDADDVISEAGKGYVSLSVQADAGFQTTRAVNEDDYKDTDKYTIQILTAEGKVVEEYTGASLPSELIELSNGSYSVKAFYGTDLPASTESMYVEGNKPFDINSDQVEVKVACAPVCARVKVVYEGMDEYFSDWKAEFKTEALGQSVFPLTKDMTDPVYLKVNEKGEKAKVSFTLTKEDGTSTSINKEYTLERNKALTITLKPVVESTGSGQLGIQIEIDGSTNDIPVDIEIPSDWV